MGLSREEIDVKRWKPLFDVSVEDRDPPFQLFDLVLSVIDVLYTGRALDLLTVTPHALPYNHSTIQLCNYTTIQLYNHVLLHLSSRKYNHTWSRIVRPIRVLDLSPIRLNNRVQPCFKYRIPN
jgi:hypothetical protein